VKVLVKENKCMDFGGWRYALDDQDWRNGTYRHFIFMNSSVRGPYLPLYIPSSVHWTSLFTQFLTDPTLAPGPVKLAGISINCALGPHVQSMIWAIDLVYTFSLTLVPLPWRVGLNLVLGQEALVYVVDTTTVLECKHDMTWAIMYGEIALSRTILARGWNIACMLVAYRGWDFRVSKECSSAQVTLLPFPFTN
jgi:hypothetical protein